MDSFNNITIRKPLPLRRRHSEIDMSRLSLEDNFLSSTLSEGLDFSTKSVPMPSENYLAEIQELKHEVKMLQSENTTAHEEIANLNIECKHLKKELTEKDKQIQFLKNVSCSSVPIPSTPAATTPYKKSITPTLKRLTNIRMRIPRLSPINNSGNIYFTETPKSRAQGLTQPDLKLQKLPLPMAQNQSAAINLEVSELSSAKPEEHKDQTIKKCGSTDGATSIEKKENFDIGGRTSPRLSRSNMHRPK